MGFVHILILSTCSNALIFIVLLLLKAENKLANRFLALLIFSQAFTLFTSLILDLKWYDRWPELHWLPFSLTYAIGPSFYLYVLFLNNPAKKFDKKLLWHFAPVTLNYFHSGYHLIWGRNLPYPRLHNFTEALEVYALLPILIYAFLSFNILKKHQIEIRQQLSMVDNITLKWLGQIKWIFITTLVPILVFVIVDYEIFINFNKEFYQGYLFSQDAILHAALAVSIYWMSIGGYRQAQIINNKALVLSLATIAENKEVTYKPELLNLLKKAMEEDLMYLDATLSIKQLEEHLGADARDISHALNRGLGQNFYAFINTYRLEEAKRRIVLEKYSHLSILGIAFDSGFNSKATFNRTFKQYTGLSPKNYKTNHFKALA